MLNPSIKTEQADSKTPNLWTIFTPKLGDRVSLWIPKCKWGGTNQQQLKICSGNHREKREGMCQMRTGDHKTASRFHQKHSRPIRRQQLKLAGFYLKNLLSTSSSSTVGSHPWAVGHAIRWIDISPLISPADSSDAHFMTLQGLISQGLVNEALVLPGAYSRGQLYNTTLCWLSLLLVVSHFSSPESFPK